MVARKVVRNLDIDSCPIVFPLSRAQRIMRDSRRTRNQSGERARRSAVVWCQQQGITRALHEKFSVLIHALRRSANTISRTLIWVNSRRGYSRSMTTYAVEQLRNYVHTIHGKA